MDSAIATIGQYRILRQLKHRTSNRLYVALGLSASSPLYIIKIYKNQSGYHTEKSVFSFQHLYQNFFVEACDSFSHQGSNIQFIASRYSNCESLVEMGMLVRQFPLDAVKFYINDIFSKLKFIHYEKKIPFRTLHASDIIVGEDKNLFLVGWSKEEQKVTQQQLIFDCAEILYYMLTFGAFQETGLGFKGTGKKRFLSQDFWDISKKKHPYLKYFPKDKAQLDQLVNFFHTITVRNEETPITLQKILSDPFFNSTPSFQVASQSLTKKQLERISANKEKDLKNFDIKIKRTKIVNESFRSLQPQQQYEIIKTPLILGKQEGNSKLADMIEKFLITNFNANLNKNTVFGEEWATLSSYQIQKSIKENKIEYIMDCQVKVVESEDVIPDLELVTFIIEVIVQTENIGGSCIKNCSARCNKECNEILVNKFEQFASEGLKQSFKYSSG